MAGGVIVPSDGPAADYGGGLTLSVFMTCLVAASGGLIFGYDIGISGACVLLPLLVLSALAPSISSHARCMRLPARISSRTAVKLTQQKILRSNEQIL
jgi:hypothetical protein